MFWMLFAIFFAACLGAGATGGLFPPGPWYRALKKPSWTPPDWVFPVAWFVLYVCMSLAGARVAMLPMAGLALALWALQISINSLWTPIFFGLQNIRMGMFVLIALWFSVLATLSALWIVDWVAGLLFVPYLVWVTIAAALNGAVWQMNPDQIQPQS